MTFSTASSCCPPVAYSACIRGNCASTLDRAIKVPVRPTPAEQCTRIGGSFSGSGESNEMHSCS